MLIQARIFIAVLLGGGAADHTCWALEVPGINRIASVSTRLVSGTSFSNSIHAERLRFCSLRCIDSEISYHEGER
jgi:hypothetical protein